MLDVDAPMTAAEERRARAVYKACADLAMCDGCSKWAHQSIMHQRRWLAVADAAINTLCWDGERVAKALSDLLAATGLDAAQLESAVIRGPRVRTWKLLPASAYVAGRPGQVHIRATYSCDGQESARNFPIADCIPATIEE